MFVFTQCPICYTISMNDAERKIGEMTAELLARFTSEFESPATFLQRPDISDIAKILRSRGGSDIACAAWFVAPNFRLDGAMPIDLIGFDDARVIDAARHAWEPPLG